MTLPHDTTCPTCGGDLSEHVLVSGGNDDDYYQCIEELLVKQAEDGDEVATAAMALIQRLKGSKFQDPDEPRFEIEGNANSIGKGVPPGWKPVAVPTIENTTAQQRRVINSDGVTFLGWDENNRPVVQATSGIPRQKRPPMALTRAGDPVDIKGQVRPEFR